MLPEPGSTLQLQQQSRKRHPRRFQIRPQVKPGFFLQYFAFIPFAFIPSVAVQVLAERFSKSVQMNPDNPGLAATCRTSADSFPFPKTLSLKISPKMKAWRTIIVM
jgi:hypothetical protein